MRPLSHSELSSTVLYRTIFCCSSPFALLAAHTSTAISSRLTRNRSLPRTGSQRRRLFYRFFSLFVAGDNRSSFFAGLLLLSKLLARSYLIFDPKRVSFTAHTNQLGVVYCKIIPPKAVLLHTLLLLLPSNTLSSAAPTRRRPTSAAVRTDERPHRFRVQV